MISLSNRTFWGKLPIFIIALSAGMSFAGFVRESPGTVVLVVDNNYNVDLSSLQTIFPEYPILSPGEDGVNGADGINWKIVGDFKLSIHGSLFARGQDGQGGADGSPMSGQDGGDGGKGGKGGSIYIAAEYIHPYGDIIFDLSGGNGGSGAAGAMNSICGEPSGNGGDGGDGGKPGSVSIHGLIDDWDDSQITGACERFYINSVGGQGGDGGRAGMDNIQTVFFGDLGTNGAGGNSYRCNGDGPAFGGNGGPFMDLSEWSCSGEYVSNHDLIAGPDGQTIEYCPHEYLGSCDDSVLVWPPWPQGIPSGGPWVSYPPTGYPLPPDDPPPCPISDDIALCPYSPDPGNPVPGDPSGPAGDGGDAIGDPGGPVVPDCLAALPGNTLATAENLTCGDAKQGWFIKEVNGQAYSYCADIPFYGETASESLWRDRAWKIQPAAGTSVTIAARTNLSPYMLIVMKSSTTLPVGKVKSYGDYSSYLDFIADGSEYYVVYQAWSPISEYRIRVTCGPAPVAANDEYMFAPSVSCGYSISGVPITTYGTESTMYPQPGSQHSKDVWYKITVPPSSPTSGNQSITVTFNDGWQNGGDALVAIYSSFGYLGNLLTYSDVVNSNRSVSATETFPNTGGAHYFFIRVASNSTSTNQSLSISCFNKLQ